MKSILLSTVMITLSIAIGEAGEIDGKWGFGTRLFGSNYYGYTPNLLILRGISNRTAILGLVSASYNFDSSSNWYASIGSGGEFRRYFRVENKISPYLGLGPSFMYSKSKSSFSDRIRWNADFGFTSGAEYFVNDVLSLSTHISYLMFSIDREKAEYSDGDMSLDTDLILSITFIPSLILRLYF